jgi:predicted Zn finger-like uncharacterized protein
MKIVCEACQAKYSIADEKVRGKVFKIRCKKCGHVIVVRGSGEVVTTGPQANEFASAPSSAADLAMDAGWHIVVDGEQVGPLSEADVRARLSRGEITVDTYIWREGLSDWVKVSTLPEFGEAEGANPFNAGHDVEIGAFEADAPTVVAQPAPGPAFTPAAAAGGAVPPISDLFAPTAGDGANTTVSSSPGIAFERSESYARSSGNGSLGAAKTASLTGQRHENSVLFSLANLEALAKPGASPISLPRTSAANPPSSSTTTEGSGLIDIRAMASMTLGGAGAKADSKGDDLPAFSAPQFSPVAPVLLPMGSSGTPRWAIVVLSVLGLAIVALGVVVVKMFTASSAAPPTVAVAPAAAPPVTPIAVTPTPPTGQPPATPPPVANEVLPPRDTPGDKPQGASANRPAGRAVRGPGARRGSGGPRNPLVSIPDRADGSPATAPAARAPAEARPKPRDDIEALLEAASGGRRAAAPARREEEEAPARAGEKAAMLERDDIVKGMNAVMPRARDCYAQFKVPGVAMVKVTVSPSGRVGAVAVTGRFAGTPSGSCVENALKTAKFPPSAGRTFDYVVPLR